MKEVPLPSGTETIPARILSNSGESFAATMVIKRWTDQERNARAFKRTVRIVGTIFACSLIGLFVHILLLVILPTLFMTTVATLPLYLRLKGEQITFFSVSGHCPYCKQDRRLRPYIDTQLHDEVTIQCPDCGQTSKATSSSLL